MIASARAFTVRFGRWIVNDAPLPETLSETERESIDWLRFTPFALIHLACLAVFVTGISAVAIAVAVGLYLIRMFAITAFYHRYFSHRSYRVGRVAQFVMAVIGCTAGQRGPIWWAGHHREHHLTSDTPADPHSPLFKGFLRSHTGWFLTRGSFATLDGRVRDLLRFPELRWLERFEWVPFVALAGLVFALGAWLEAAWPGLGTSGPQMLVVGFFTSTVAVYHATYSTNSVAHRFGSRRFDTDDDSRNNPWVALVTLGEGWHNNHHHYPASARHGLTEREVDLTWLGIRAMRAVGLARDVRLMPARTRAQARDGLRPRTQTASKAPSVALPTGAAATEVTS